MTSEKQQKAETLDTFRGSPANLGTCIFQLHPATGRIEGPAHSFPTSVAILMHRPCLTYGQLSKLEPAGHVSGVGKHL